MPGPEYAEPKTKKNRKTKDSRNDFIELLKKKGIPKPTTKARQNVKTIEVKKGGRIGKMGGGMAMKKRKTYKKGGKAK